jgi:predicted thioesterase
MDARDGTTRHDGPVVGSTAEVLHEVGDADTAIALGSGDVPVLATPRLLALAEQATVAAVAPALPAGQTTVGTRVEIDHVEASPVGSKVLVRATLVHVQGRSLSFEVTAEHPADRRLVGHGRVTRVLLDRDRFLRRLG